MASDSLKMLEKAIEEEKDNPAELLRAIFRFMHFKPAKIDIYFLLLDNKKSMTITEMKGSLNYSERTIRKYIKDLLASGYIKKETVERTRPCFAYKAVSPKVVWRKLVEEIRVIRKQAYKSISKME
jgi:predicted DNA-binding transcriptional regulator